MSEINGPVAIESLSPGRRGVFAALLEFPETTVIALSDAARVPRSSTAEALKYLEVRGMATRKVFPIQDGKPRPADIWSAVSTATVVPAEGGGEGAGDTSAAPTPGTLEVLSGEAQDVEHRAEVTAAPVAPSAGSEPRTLERLGKGVLRDAVRRHLLAHPEVAFTPTALSKALVKSSGAISNALDVLVARGEAVLVLEKPRTFRAPASGNR